MAIAEPPRMTPKLVGTSIKRKEDPRLITGNGQYLDDIKLPGMAHVAILRSPHAHARIHHIDTSAARALPGVIDVITGADLVDSVNPLPCAFPAGGVENHIPPHRVLAVDRVRYVGDGVAAVVAEDELSAVVDVERALEQGGAPVWDNAPGNEAYRTEAGDKAATEAAFKNAHLVASLRIVNQRLIPNPMETRGAIARYDPGTGEMTIWMTSQCPHVHKILLAAFVLGIPEHKVRCIAPEVGGGFGSKIFVYPDMAICAVLAKRVGRPVKFVETRSENYVATTHGRDHIQDVELAATRDGTITGLRVRSLANLGAYASTGAPGVVATLFGRMVSGCYKIPHIFNEAYGVYTNTSMVDAYRGAGRPEATYLIERMVDLLAAELQMDPAEVRRKNFIPPEAFPYEPPALGLVPYDTGEYARALDAALAKASYAELRRQQQEARAQGRLMGIGLSSYVEICGLAPSDWVQKEGWGGPLYESAHVRVLATGKVVATTGTTASTALASSLTPFPRSSASSLSRTCTTHLTSRRYAARARRARGRWSTRSGRGARPRRTAAPRRCGARTARRRRRRGDPARRHRAGALRPGHLWQPLAGRRRLGPGAGQRQAAREDQGHRRPPARGRRRGRGVRERRRRGEGRAGPPEDLCRDRHGRLAGHLAAAGHGGVAGGDRGLRSARLHLPLRHARVRRRDRS